MVYRPTRTSFWRSQNLCITTLSGLRNRLGRIDQRIDLRLSDDGMLLPFSAYHELDLPVLLVKQVKRNYIGLHRRIAKLKSSNRSSFDRMDCLGVRVASKRFIA